MGAFGNALARRFKRKSSLLYCVTEGNLLASVSSASRWKQPYTLSLSCPYSLKDTVCLGADCSNKWIPFALSSEASGYAMCSARSDVL